MLRRRNGSTRPSVNRSGICERQAQLRGCVVGLEAAAGSLAELWSSIYPTAVHRMRLSEGLARLHAATRETALLKSRSFAKPAICPCHLFESAILKRYHRPVEPGKGARKRQVFESRGGEKWQEMLALLRLRGALGNCLLLARDAIEQASVLAAESRRRASVLTFAAGGPLPPLCDSSHTKPSNSVGAAARDETQTRPNCGTSGSRAQL